MNNYQLTDAQQSQLDAIERRWKEIRLSGAPEVTAAEIISFLLEWELGEPSAGFFSAGILHNQRRTGHKL